MRNWSSIVLRSDVSAKNSPGSSRTEFSSLRTFQRNWIRSDSEGDVDDQRRRNSLKMLVRFNFKNRQWRDI